MILDPFQEKGSLTVDDPEPINLIEASDSIGLWITKVKSLALTLRADHDNLVNELHDRSIVSTPNQVFSSHHPGPETIKFLGQV